MYYLTNEALVQPFVKKKLHAVHMLKNTFMSDYSPNDLNVSSAYNPGDFVQIL